MCFVYNLQEKILQRSCKMSSFKKQFDLFMQNLSEPVSKNTLDYLGINFSEANSKPVFKIYYATRVSPYREHPLIKFLYGRDMLRDFAMVKDTISSRYLRLDIAIKNRNDQNMTALFNELNSMTNLFDECKDEIIYLSDMRMTDAEEYRYASLYHLGLTQQDNVIESLKWYCFLRWCENPEVPGKNSQYRDEYYLDFLRKTNIGEFKQLIPYIEKILESCGGHLWIGAVDVKENGYRKYKIYVKDPENFYDKMNIILDKKVQQQLSDLSSWHMEHEEFEFNGLALCLDTEGEFSINTYYSFA